MVDLDDTVLKIIYRTLGDLMIKRRINLMPYFTVFRKTIEGWLLQLNIFDVDYCQVLTLPGRLLCIVGMIVLNAYMIASFLRGIQESGSVVAPSLSTAANFTTSALYGALVWHERMNLQWLVGFVCVLLGVMLLSNTTPAEDGEGATKATQSKSVKTTISNFKKSSTIPKTVIKTAPPQL
jgi:drug/metabolite transporter (DMT)-like permease